MKRIDRRYLAAALLMLLTATLYLPIAAFAPGAYGLQALVAAAVLAALGLGVWRCWRWVGHLAFIAALFGTSYALAAAFDASGSVSILFWIIVALDVLTAIVLFGLLWSRPEPARRAGE